MYTADQQRALITNSSAKVCEIRIVSPAKTHDGVGLESEMQGVATCLKAQHSGNGSQSYRERTSAILS